MQSIDPIITASSNDVSLLINETQILLVGIQGLSPNEVVSLQFWMQHEGLIKVDPNNLTMDTNEMYKVSLTGLQPGYVCIELESPTHYN